MWVVEYSNNGLSASEPSRTIEFPAKYHNQAGDFVSFFDDEGCLVWAFATHLVRSIQRRSA